MMHEFDANVALATIGAKFSIGDRVRHFTQDTDEKSGMVTAVKIRPGALVYIVAFSNMGCESECCDFELEADEVNSTS